MEKQFLSTWNQAQATTLIQFWQGCSVDVQAILNKSHFNKLDPLIPQGNIHVLHNQDLGFSGPPPPPPFVITFSTERNQKLPFSDSNMD